jgi:hypothetical protein
VKRRLSTVSNEVNAEAKESPLLEFVTSKRLMKTKKTEEV